MSNFIKYEFPKNEAKMINGDILVQFFFVVCALDLFHSFFGDEKLLETAEKDYYFL